MIEEVYRDFKKGAEEANMKLTEHEEKEIKQIVEDEKEGKNE